MKSTFTVPDASCEHCWQKLTSAVSAEDGVEQVEVDLEERTVTIEHDQRASHERLTATIVGQGYKFEGEPLSG